MLAPPVMLLLLAWPALAIDGWAARFRYDGGRVNPTAELLATLEVFGNGFGIALIGLAIYVLMPGYRRMLPRLVLTCWGAGIVANLAKLLVARQRPYYWLAQGGPEIWDTFVGWLPLGLNRGAQQSMPSSHTACAFALALLLGWMFPRGRWFFLAMAVLVGWQRVALDAHFVSDVLVGGAVGWLLALAAFRWKFAAGLYDRWERPAIAAAEAPQRVAHRRLLLRKGKGHRRAASVAGGMPIRIDANKKGPPG